MGFNSAFKGLNWTLYAELLRL